MDRLGLSRPFSEVLSQALQDTKTRAEWERRQVARDVSILLLRYRTRHGISQARLASLLGITTAAVSRLEGGE